MTDTEALYKTAEVMLVLFGTAMFCTVMIFGAGAIVVRIMAWAERNRGGDDD